MFKIRITNTSGERGPGFARPIFLTEAGRLLQPGDAAPINRLDKGTEELVSAGDLKVEQGAFPAYVAPKKKKPKVVDDDDEDAPPKRAKADPNEKSGFTTITGKKGAKNIVPLRAPGAEDDDEEEEEVLSASSGDDDEPDDIPSVTKADVGKGTGQADLDDEDKPSPASSGFHDNLRVGKSKN